MRDTFIAYCRPDMYPAQFGDNLADLILYDGCNNQRVKNRGSLITGPRITSARNQLVRAFLQSECEWLWMLDADMTFPQTHLDQMRYVCEQKDIQFLGGLAFKGGRGYGMDPVLYTEVDGEPREVADYPDNRLVRVWATGAACLLVHRAVLEDVQRKYGERVHPWFEELEVDGHEWGEDVTFCRRVSDCGYDLYVHTGIEFGHLHLGAVLSSSEFRRRQQLSDEQLAAERAAWMRMMGQ